MNLCPMRPEASTALFRKEKKPYVIDKTYTLFLCYSHSILLIENPRESNLCLLKPTASLVKDKC